MEPQLAGDQPSAPQQQQPPKPRPKKGKLTFIKGFSRSQEIELSNY